MSRPYLAAIGLAPMERRLTARTTKREEPPPLGSSQRSDDWWLRHPARSSSQSSPHRGKLGGGGSWKVLVSSGQSALHRDQPGGGGCLNVMDNATPVIVFPSPSGKWSGKSMETTFHLADSELQKSSAKSHMLSAGSGISFPPPKIRSGKWKVEQASAGGSKTRPQPPDTSLPDKPAVAHRLSQAPPPGRQNSGRKLN